MLFQASDEPVDIAIARLVAGSSRRNGFLMPADCERALEACPGYFYLAANRLAALNLKVGHLQEQIYFKTKIVVVYALCLLSNISGLMWFIFWVHP
jgi:hypothetical protein